MLFSKVGSGEINAPFDPILNSNSVELTIIHLKNRFIKTVNSHAITSTRQNINKTPIKEHSSLLTKDV